MPDLPSGPPPPVDTSIHSVPLEDGVFDRFNGGFARLSEASETQIASLRDRIRPVYQPNSEGPKGGVYLFPGELIIESATEDYAYPMQRDAMSGKIKGTCPLDPRCSSNNDDDLAVH